ncbi:MAG TPA: hypothetical protein VK203_10820 [Nostocaceae cyanobacterium]|nr:hypothetical protein [Nostocaceae cyanobacterium]
MKVFFTGTENLITVNPEVIMRIRNVINLNAHILIGNYRGFDQWCLQYLKSLQYPHVTVFETGSKLSFGYELLDVGKYPAQDIHMAKTAGWILAIDRKDKPSPGVQRNIKRLPPNHVRVVYV